MRKSLVIRPDLATAVHTTADTVGKLQPSVGKNSMPRKLMVQLLGLTAGLTLSAWGYAVGLGGINVVSALGQPLKVEIGLLAVGRADKPTLVARLASPDAYKGAGLDYPYGVKYSFKLENHANGEPYLAVRSDREISDPFVSLLVDLSWASGRVMREYTFLLDPPGYVAVQPKAAALQPVAPVVVEPLSESAAPVEKPAERIVQKSVERPIESVAERPEQRLTKSRAHEAVATGEITVKSGDTLNLIAERTKPDEVSLERMLVALYRANDAQFDGKNMNRIRAGKILRMPDQSELSRLSQRDAVQEIHAQASDWNAYRQKLAAAAPTDHGHEAGGHVASGKITSAVADKTPVASGSAREVLRLSKGETPGDKTGAAGKSGSAQDKKNSAQEEAIAKGQAIEEEKKRAALLEANMKDMQRLAQLKSEAAALSASAAGAASAVAATSAVEAASAVAPVSHVAAASAVKSVPKHKVEPVASPSFLDELMNNPLFLGVGATALLALAGLGIVISRRKKARLKPVRVARDDFGATTGHLTMPVVPSPDTGDFTSLAHTDEEPEVQADEVDPISEADLFLNFGRDEQAEEILKDALLHMPDNHKVHLKLLGIYADRQDAASFAKIAALLHDTGDVDAILQAEALARKLVVADSQHEEASLEDAQSATQFMSALDMSGELESAPASHELDIPDLEIPEIGFPAQTADTSFIDFDVTAMPEAQAGAVDFDVTSTSPMSAVANVLDFDIAGKEIELAAAEHEEEALPSLNDLIFDMTPALEGHDEIEAEPAVEPPAEEAGGMEFTLDFPIDDVAEPAKPLPPAINLADINLNMDDLSEPVSEPVVAEKSEHWHEVATKLDLAKAYQEMGDDVGAREILDEVMKEGDEGQQQEAQLLLGQIG